MNILPELGEIAAAKYGLQLKDPIFRALDKLVQDPKFELVKNIVDDDYADFDGQMKNYFSELDTGNILKIFLNLVGVINGRKGFYSKVENPEGKENICYWLDMLIGELIHASTQQPAYTLGSMGDGIINGQRFRAAMYYILDILGSGNAISAETVSFKTNTSCYIYGRELSSIKIYGNADGVGERGLVLYTVTFRVYNMLELGWDSDYQEFTATIGNNPLYEGDSATITIPDNILTPQPPTAYGYNGVWKLELQTFTTDIEPTFKLTREPTYESQDSDYRYITDESSSTSLAYLNDKKRLVVPTTLGGQPLKTIGNTTFGYSDVNTVILQEGIETIE